MGMSVDECSLASSPRDSHTIIVAYGRSILTGKPEMEFKNV